MKKALAAFGVLSAALVLMVAPVSAQTPADIKATITTAPASPTAGATVNVTTVFSIPVLSGTGADGQRHIQRWPGHSGLVHPGPVVLPHHGHVGDLHLVDARSRVASDHRDLGPRSRDLDDVHRRRRRRWSADPEGDSDCHRRSPPRRPPSRVARPPGPPRPRPRHTPTTVAPPPTEAPTTTVAPTTTAAGTLPATGTNSNAPLMIAIVAIALGAVLLGATRLVRSRS